MQLPKGPSIIKQTTQDATWKKVSPEKQATHDEERRIRQAMRVYPDKLPQRKAAPRAFAATDSAR